MNEKNTVNSEPADRMNFFDVLKHNLPHDKKSDTLFSYLCFLSVHGRPPSNEMLFNDVIYRIKTSSEIDSPLRVFTTDKHLMKMFVKAEVGDAFNVPTLDVLFSSTEVDKYAFHSKSCVKPTHMSGHVIFNDGEKPVDREKMKNWLRQNYYMVMREANYKNLIPKIIIEPILFDDRNLFDYKFFCFEGVPKLIQIDFDRRTAHSRHYYYPSWERVNINLQYPTYAGTLEKPSALTEMLEIAAHLSRHFNFVRIDMYSGENKFFVGEITHCHAAALERFFSRDDEILMSKIIFG